MVYIFRAVLLIWYFFVVLWTSADSCTWILSCEDTPPEDGVTVGTKTCRGLNDCAFNLF
jgi:hypothetical protein